MKKYEVMFITKDDQGKSQETETAKLANIINGDGGEIKSVDHWGVKRLAYEIQDQETGDYSLITFFANPGTIKEIDRVLRLSEQTLRHMIILCE